MTPALFLDRDGVINEETNYLYRREDVRWVDGIFSLVRAANDRGWKVVVVTNQGGIGRRFYTEAQFHELMAWMRDEFIQRGARLDAVYFCAVHPEGFDELRGDSPDRKPSPGMLLRAAQDLGIDLAASWMVGDRCTDIDAARAAGLAEAFLLTGTEAQACDATPVVVQSLREVEARLRGESRV